jgi:hypothetical protein
MYLTYDSLIGGLIRLFLLMTTLIMELNFIGISSLCYLSSSSGMI